MHIPVGLLESDDQIAKEDTVMSFRGAVKPSWDLELAFRQVFCDVTCRRTTDDAGRPALDLCHKGQALMLRVSPTEATQLARRMPSCRRTTSRQRPRDVEFPPCPTVIRAGAFF